MLKEDHSVREEGVERSRMESPETEPPPPESSPAARSLDAAWELHLCWGCPVDLDVWGSPQLARCRTPRP